MPCPVQDREHASLPVATALPVAAREGWEGRGRLPEAPGSRKQARGELRPGHVPPQNTGSIPTVSLRLQWELSGARSLPHGDRLSTDALRGPFRTGFAQRGGPGAAPLPRLVAAGRLYL